MSLRSKLIRVAHENPGPVREALLPLLKKARIKAEYGTALDRMDRRKASRIVNKILAQYTRGFFSDSFWKPVQQIRKAMEAANVPFYLTDNFYEKDERGNPSSKTWIIEVPFINDKNREMSLNGRIVASGNGPVDDPLASYDVTAYVN